MNIECWKKILRLGHGKIHRRDGKIRKYQKVINVHPRTFSLFSSAFSQLQNHHKLFYDENWKISFNTKSSFFVFALHTWENSSKSCLALDFEFRFALLKILRLLLLVDYLIILIRFATDVIIHLFSPLLEGKSANSTTCTMYSNRMWSVYEVKKESSSLFDLRVLFFHLLQQRKVNWNSFNRASIDLLYDHSVPLTQMINSI